MSVSFQKSTHKFVLGLIGVFSKHPTISSTIALVFQDAVVHFRRRRSTWPVNASPEITGRSDCVAPGVHPERPLCLSAAQTLEFVGNIRRFSFFKNAKSRGACNLLRRHLVAGRLSNGREGGDGTEGLPPVFPRFQPNRRIKEASVWCFSR